MLNVELSVTLAGLDGNTRPVECIGNNTGKTIFDGATIEHLTLMLNVHLIGTVVGLDG